MILILLINGSPDKILIRMQGRGMLKLVKIDEKDLASAAEIRRIIAVHKPHRVVFACQDLAFQRFIFFMKYYIWRFSDGGGAIIDESGERIEYNTFGFIFRDVPAIALEAIASGFVIIYYYLKFPLLRKFRKKS
ncbi:MAG: hypothetical protein ACLFQX_09525 [Candidatus Kapaibacterium sp.]